MLHFALKSKMTLKETMTRDRTRVLMLKHIAEKCAEVSTFDLFLNYYQEASMKVPINDFAYGEEIAQGRLKRDMSHEHK